MIELRKIIRNLLIEALVAKHYLDRIGERIDSYFINNEIPVGYQIGNRLNFKKVGNYKTDPSILDFIKTRLQRVEKYNFDLNQDFAVKRYKFNINKDDVEFDSIEDKKYVYKNNPTLVFMDRVDKGGDVLYAIVRNNVITTLMWAKSDFPGDLRVNKVFDFSR